MIRFAKKKKNELQKILYVSKLLLGFENILKTNVFGCTKKSQKFDLSDIELLKKGEFLEFQGHERL